jgi:sugar transferase (PEP-CTERM/EpsH1 system associated)
MQILFITPYPPSRIRVRAYGLICSLAREHTVTILTQLASQQDSRDKDALEQQGYRVVAVEVSKAQALRQCGMALWGTEPLQVAYARSTLFLRRARELCDQQHFDVIHVEHLRGIASLEPLAHDYPLVWDAVDSISRLWEQTAVAGQSIALRNLARLECKRTTRYESKLVRELDYVVAISDNDAEALAVVACSQGDEVEKRSLRKKITVVPNGVDLDYFNVRAQTYRPYNIVFSGKMSYHANVAAVQYLYREIMPLIWRVQPAATLTIVGSRPPKSVQRLTADKRIEVTGFVEDIRPFIRRAHVVVCPMVYSVGQQNKALEAMALGAPVVLSAQSVTSLDAQVGRDLLIAYDAQEFADQVLHVFTDENERASLRHYGRQYVERSHNWSTVTEQLLALYRYAISSREGERALPEHRLATAGGEKRE